MEDPTEKISSLECENAALRERLQLLEKTRSPLGQLPLGAATSAPPASNPTPRREELPVAEKDPAAIIHYLKTILGYTIRYDGSTVILRSIYSFCEEDVFEIEIQNNKLVLKSTDYLSEWGEFLNTYIRVGKSYCAFFAAVTLDLFNKKTFG